MADNTKQQRDTKQRRVIYETVMKHYDHPNADEIYEDVHRIDPRISKATVYRNLKLLSENGDIRQVKVPGADRFDRTLENHCHVICLHCGHVIDAPVSYEAGWDAAVEAQTGFWITGHQTVFEGLCPACCHLPEREESGSESIVQ